MLEARRETLKTNPALWTAKFSRARKRKTQTAMAETVTFVGFLFETPVQRHPQETTKGWLVRVSGSKHVTNGVYSVKVWEDDRPKRVFANAAKLVTGLPERGIHYGYPTFGLNEVTLSTETYNFKKPDSFFKKFARCLRTSVQGSRYVFE